MLRADSDLNIINEIAGDMKMRGVRRSKFSTKMFHKVAQRNTMGHKDFIFFLFVIQTDWNCRTRASL